MATNAPDSRKTHITRIVGTNRAGERLDDIWLDIERMDIIKGAMQIPPDLQWQGWQRKLRWHDDPDGDDDYFPEGTPSRLTQVVKVCDAETQNVDDPDEWVPVRIIKGMRSRGGGTAAMGQGFMDRFVSDQENEARIVEPRKIVHYDTNIDDAAQAAFDADPSRTEYVVPGEFYEKDLSTKDDSQFVDHEIITHLKPKTNSLKVMGQGRQTKLRNEYLIDESEPAQLKHFGILGFNPPYRLDPFQNIVNVKFRPLIDAVVGLFSRTTGKYRTIITEDGLEFENLNGGSNAASGLGYTVIAPGRSYIAFGKPRDGDACFIVAQGAKIRRGVLNQNGELEFSPIASIGSSEADSCSLAGGAFFVSYVSQDGLKSLLAVSFDGMRFNTGIDAFPGLAAASQDAEDAAFAEPDPRPAGGNVAYNPDKNIYVTVGAFLRTYYGDAHDAIGTIIRKPYVDFNFMWATSKDGLTWSAKFDVSEGSGFDHSVSTADIGANPSNIGVGSRVTFGNGIFVAATTVKGQIDIVGGGIIDRTTRTALGVATSINGSAWNNARLPGPGFAANKASDSICCKYIKRRSGHDAPGFFLLGANETVDNITTGTIWWSDNGVNWSKVLSGPDVAAIISVINHSRGTVINL